VTATAYATALAHVRGNFDPPLPDCYADWVLDLLDMAHSTPGDGSREIVVPSAVVASGYLPAAATPGDDGAHTITLYAALAALRLSHELEPHDEHVQITMGHLVDLLAALTDAQTTEDDVVQARRLVAAYRRLEYAALTAGDTTDSNAAFTDVSGPHQAVAHLAAALSALGVHGRLQQTETGILLLALDIPNTTHLATQLDIFLTDTHNQPPPPDQESNQ